MEHGDADPLGARHILLTGAGGQLGAALAEEFPEADARTRGELDVTAPIEVRPGLVLHTAAWTGVDAAESDPDGAEAVNVTVWVPSRSASSTAVATKTAVDCPAGTVMFGGT